jgi:hypothetical protein
MPRSEGGTGDVPSVQNSGHIQRTRAPISMRNLTPVPLPLFPHLLHTLPYWVGNGGGAQALNERLRLLLFACFFCLFYSAKVLFSITFGFSV